MASYYTALRIIERKRKRSLLTKKVLKDLQNPFNLDENAFKKKYCLSQKGVQYITQLLGPIMKRSHGYPAEMQILSSLQVLRSGCFQQQIGEDQIINVSQATISRGLDSFLDAILEIVPKMIEFPSFSELAFTEQKYYGQSKIPNIIGVLDCINVLINKPHVPDYEEYMSGKNEYSIKVELVCDSDLCILDAVVNSPGSAPNHLIWKYSSLRTALKDNFNTVPNKSYLIGDNSFPLEPWLLVPYEDWHKSEELIFNDHVRRAVSVMQTCLATLRSRFRCLHPKFGPLHYSPEKCCKIITACIVLHNICVKHGVDLNEPLDLNEYSYSLPLLYSEIDADIEESILRNEALSIRDDVARQLSKGF